MIKEMDYGQDDRTVIVNRAGEAPAQSPLTDFDTPPRFEQLEERMIYAARLRPAETFNISLNPLVAAASPLQAQPGKRRPAGPARPGAQRDQAVRASRAA